MLLRKFIRESIMSEGVFEKKLVDVQGVVDRIKNKVVIFVDTETTSVSPRKDFAMITEIAGMAYDTSTGELLDSYNSKASLNQSVVDRIAKETERKKAGDWDERNKSVEDILGMTGYKDWDKPYIEEKVMLEEFSKFMEAFQGRDAMIAAHNARFDMYFINKSLEKHGLPKIKGMPVVDTLVLVRNYLKPMLETLKASKDPDALKLLASLQPQKRFLTNLSDLGKAFEISAEHWHSALSDTSQLAGILAALISFFESKAGSIT